MKRITVLLAAALAAAACAKKPETARAPDAAARTLPTAAVVRETSAGRVEIDGVVVGRIETVLSSRLAAPVAEVRAVPGESVRAGAVLVRLESR